MWCVPFLCFFFCQLVRPLSIKQPGEIKAGQKSKLESQGMAMSVFGYGSLIWKAGFPFDEIVECFIKGYRRVFHQGSTDHRGTPEYPGRTVTIEPAEGEYLEVGEKQYDKKAYFDVFTELAATTPAISGVKIHSISRQERQQKLLGPSIFEEIARQIIRAEGPSGPNRDYLFQLEKALLQIGCQDKHVMDLANEVRRILSEEK